MAGKPMTGLRITRITNGVVKVLIEPEEVITQKTVKPLPTIIQEYDDIPNIKKGKPASKSKNRNS